MKGARKVLEKCPGMVQDHTFSLFLSPSLSTVKCDQLSRPAALAHPPSFGACLGHKQARKARRCDSYLQI